MPEEIDRGRSLSASCAVRSSPRQSRSPEDSQRDGTLFPANPSPPDARNLIMFSPPCRPSKTFHVEQKISTPHPQKTPRILRKTRVPQVLHSLPTSAQGRMHCHETAHSIPFFNADDHHPPRQQAATRTQAIKGHRRRQPEGRSRQNHHCDQSRCGHRSRGLAYPPDRLRPPG